MATLAFGGPVFDEASNRVVVRDHVDRPRVGPMPRARPGWPRRRARAWPGSRLDGLWTGWRSC